MPSAEKNFVHLHVHSDYSLLAHLTRYDSTHGRFAGADFTLTAPDATSYLVDAQRGITEIRSILGGLFIGLGIAVFILGVRETYQMLGIMYLAIAAVRLVWDLKEPPARYLQPGPLTPRAAAP